MDDRVKHLIKIAKPIIEKYDEIEKSKGEKFNLFSILKMENKEVETHSAFLYELINPNGSHQHGDLYLKFFIKSVLNLKIEDFDFNSVRVYRELYANEYGRIDLAIEDKNQIIAIEIKVDADDQEKQLKRYSNYLSNIEKYFNKKSKIFYLTKYGTEATEKSTAGETIDYVTVSFMIDIVHFIDKCINETTIQLIKENLKQYLILVKKITNQRNNDYEKEIIKMINSQEDIKVATKLFEMLPNIWASKEVEFWDKLSENLDDIIKEKGFVEYIYDMDLYDEQLDEYKPFEDRVKIVANKRMKNKNSWFGLDYKKSLNQQIEVMLSVFQNGNIHESIYISMKLLDMEGNHIELKKEIEKILTEIGLFKKDKNVKYTPINEPKVKFFSRLEEKDSYSYDELTWELFDSLKFEQLTEGISQRIIQTVDAFLQNEQKIIGLLQK